MSKGPRVLVVDDDEIVRRAMCRILQSGGCTVLHTGSSVDVANSIIDEQIDVIVLDVMMPDISGDELAKLLRNNPTTHLISIVLVSGTDATTLAHTASRVKADALVAKADIHQELSKVVWAAFKKRHAPT